ncbi:Cuticular protein analogous to peritrophins 3-A2, partial [Operophtera brumata]
ACDKFLYCAEGVPNEHSCPPGLYFDEDSSNCDWKESVNRKCDQITKGFAVNSEYPASTSSTHI